MIFYFCLDVLKYESRVVPGVKINAHCSAYSSILSFNMAGEILAITCRKKWLEGAHHFLILSFHILTVSHLIIFRCWKYCFRLYLWCCVQNDHNYRQAVKHHSSGQNRTYILFSEQSWTLTVSCIHEQQSENDIRGMIQKICHCLGYSKIWLQIVLC